MATENSPYQLWVFNSNTTVADLIEHSKKNTTTHLILLSTHYLHAHEREELTSSISAQIQFHYFGEFNEDATMESIDQLAFEKNSEVVKRYSIYINRFKITMNFERNAFIHKALQQRYSIEQATVFCTSFDPVNLGISFAYWKTTKAKVHDISEGIQLLKTFFKLPLLEKTIYHFKALLNSFAPRKVEQFSHEGYKWSVHSRRRLALKKALPTKSSLIIPLIASRNKKQYHLIGLHESGKVLNLRPYCSMKQTVIAGDAYRPEVYPPYLFAKPFESLRYIARDRTDLNFFKKNGLKTFDKRPDFMESQQIEITETVKRIQTVFLSINHAGDWSALINRSDTDLLLEAFVQLARDIPSLHFIIRPHPTMNGPRAEGNRAISRIEELVQAVKLQNIEVSKLSLEEDWARGDLFISEYSLSVIDAMKRGKLGLFCNLTRRRSFMHDLEKLGFDCVSSYDELHIQVQSALENHELANRNREALKKYKEAVLL